MNPFRVLHITDFHINDSNSVKENLRKGYYREFLNGLVDKIASVFGQDAIDIIAATGDFVEKNKSANYPYVKEVLDYLINKLNLTSKSVIMCPGNHDIDYTLDATDSRKAREDYYSFASNFSCGASVINKNRFSLSKFKDNVYILIIDNTLGSNGEKIPGAISTQEIDEIVNEVTIDTVSKKDFLLIASHFPVNINSRSRLLTEEDDWMKKHYWTSGIPLVSRVIDIRNDAATLWLYGDSHSPDFFSYDKKHHFVMTGMIGGNHVDRFYTERGTDGSAVTKTFELQTEVKIIEFIALDQEPIIHTFFYKRQGITPAPSDGKWDYTSSATRPEQLLIKLSNASSAQTIDTTDNSIISVDKKTSIISSSVQRAIIERVTDQNLYAIGRFSISDSDVSLGWVSLNKLFEDYQILTQCVEKAITWFDKISLDISSGDTLLVGTDFWGSIIASQISVRTLVKNVCLSTRSWGKNDELKASYLSILKAVTYNKGLKKVIIVTDVIASGNTIDNMYQYLKSNLEELELSVEKWVVISVISDIKQVRKVSFDIFDSVGTFCGDIRMPTLSSDLLPSESVLPPNLDYR